MEIAFQAYFSQGIYGAKTRIADFFKVSRTFVYQQLAILTLFLSVTYRTLPEPTMPISLDMDNFVERLIFLLNLTGNCSLQQISDILLALLRVR